MTQYDTTTFFDNLPDEAELEEAVNSFDSDQVVELMHVGRNRVIQNPEFVPTELENRALILIVRRFRGLRAAPKKKTAAKKAAPTLGQLGNMLGI